MKTFKEWVKLEEAKYVPGTRILALTNAIKHYPSAINQSRSSVLAGLMASSNNNTQGSPVVQDEE